MITIEQINNKVSGKLRGTTLVRVTDLFGKYREAAGNVLSNIDPYSTIRSTLITNALHDKVYNYACPPDLKGTDKILDIRPVSPRSKIDYLAGSYGQQFDIQKRKNNFAIEVINGVKTLRINKELTPRVEIATLEILTGGYTVATTGNANNLTINEQNNVDGRGAVSLDLEAGGQGGISITLDSPVDLSKVVNVGAFFHWMFLPNATDITSITLKFGHDTSNFYEKTITSAHDRAFTSGAWQLDRYNATNLTLTGSVNTAEVDYFEIEFNYNNTQKGVLLNSLSASVGQAYEIVYYSNMLFRGQDGTWKQEPTQDDDVLMLENTAENIFVYELSILCGHELKGKNFATDFASYTKMLHGGNKETDTGLYNEYMQQNPSEAMQKQTTYYNFKDFGADTVGEYPEDGGYGDNEYI